MNFFKLSILCTLILVLAGCKDDEPAEPICNQSNWLGTYVGTQDCDGAVEDITVTITASGSDAIIIFYEIINDYGYQSAEFDPLTPAGCTLDGSSTDPDFGITITVDSEVNGQELSFIEIWTDGSDTSTCTIVATKQ